MKISEERLARDARLIENKTEEIGGVKAMLTALFGGSAEGLLSGGLMIRMPYEEKLDEHLVLDLLGDEAYDCARAIKSQVALETGRKGLQKVQLTMGELRPFVCYPTTKTIDRKGFGAKKKAVIKNAILDELYRRLDESGRIEFWENILSDNCLGL